MPDGSYTVQVAIVDAAGNTTPLSAQLIVDNSGPAGVVDGLPDGTIVHGTGVAVSAHASDPAGVQGAQLQVGQNGVWQPLGSAFTGAGPYSATWNSVRTDDGIYAIRLAATDALGNVAYSAEHAVIVDNTIPAGPGTPIASASPTSAAPVIVWPASASSDVAGYDVYRAGQRVASGLAGTIYSDQLAGDGSQDGAYAYTVSAVDRAGNESPPSAPVAVIYDRTAPAPPASATATAAPAGTVTVSWSAGSDPASGGVSSGLVGYVLRRSTGEQVCVVAAGTTTCTDGIRPAGSYAYAVYAVDAAGNVSSTGTTASVTVARPAGKDTTPPAPAARVDAAVHGTKAALSWQNPKDRDFDHVVVVANAKHRPKTVKDGSRLYSGKADGVAASGAPGTRLFVAVYAYDRSGNVSPPVYVTATFAAERAAARERQHGRRLAAAELARRRQGDLLQRAGLPGEEARGRRLAARHRVLDPRGQAREGQDLHLVRVARLRGPEGGALRRPGGPRELHVHRLRASARPRLSGRAAMSTRRRAARSPFSLAGPSRKRRP